MKMRHKWVCSTKGYLVLLLLVAGVSLFFNVRYTFNFSDFELFKRHHTQKAVRASSHLLPATSSAASGKTSRSLSPAFTESELGWKNRSRGPALALGKGRLEQTPAPKPRVFPQPQLPQPQSTNKLPPPPPLPLPGPPPAGSNLAKDQRPSPDDPPATWTEVGTRFSQRLEQLRKGCGLFGNSSLFRRLANVTGRKLVVGPYRPAMNTSVEYCFIPKSASATWKLVFKSLDTDLKALTKASSSPKKDWTGNVTMPSSVGAPMRAAGPERNVNFLFVREPYGRLLSAYVDKLFSPNTVFWRWLGTYIVRHFRSGGLSNHSLQCGHDVTFPEFVRYFIHSQQTGQHRDGHVIPQHDQCQLCRDDYHYIGHVETMTEDMNYILNASRIPLHYKMDYRRETIRDNAMWVLQRMTLQVAQCMSQDEATRRLWRKLQIRGLVSKAEPFPFTQPQAGSVTLQRFLQAAQSASGRSTSTAAARAALRAQREEALHEAYGAVPLADRQTVKELLFLDFALFGFDPDLPAVFPPAATGTPVTGFRYFQWQ